MANYELLFELQDAFHSLFIKKERQIEGNIETARGISALRIRQILRSFGQVAPKSCYIDCATYLKLHSGYAMQITIRDECVEQKTM